MTSRIPRFTVLTALAAMAVLLLASCSDAPTSKPTTPPTSTPDPASVVDAERAALEAFYEAAGGENWTNGSNWLSAAPLGEWHGVTTDDSGRVIWLDLKENSLRGGDTAGAGRPVQSGIAATQRQSVERGDTAGAGRPVQSEIAGTQRQSVERVQPRVLAAVRESDLSAMGLPFCG